VQYGSTLASDGLRQASEDLEQLRLSGPLPSMIVRASNPLESQETGGCGLCEINSARRRPKSSKDGRQERDGIGRETPVAELIDDLL
jgi:hypothetical protein